MDSGFLFAPTLLFLALSYRMVRSAGGKGHVSQGRVLGRRRGHR